MVKLGPVCKGAQVSTRARGPVVVGESGEVVLVGVTGRALARTEQVVAVGVCLRKAKQTFNRVATYLAHLATVRSQLGAVRPSAGGSGSYHQQMARQGQEDTGPVVTYR